MIKIDRLDDFGRGICYIDNKVTFVKNALPEEIVLIDIIKETRKYNIAEMIECDNYNVNRINAPCKYYDVCGGCNLEHVNESFENNFKIEKVKNIFKKFASIDLDNINIISGNLYNYRNKITLRVKNGKLSLLKENSNELVNIDKCLIANEKINEIISIINTFNLDGIKSIMIRVGNITNEVMLDIKGDVKDINSFLNISDSLIINDKVISKEYISSYIGDKLYHIRNTSFFQINEEITNKLYSEILNIIKKINAKNVMDLYAGVASIGIFISDYVDKVLSVEVVESCLKDANENIKINNCNNIQYKCLDVSKVFDDVNIKDFDTVIIDPPRNGLDKTTKSVLNNSNCKNIIYISCDPITLARDIKDLNNYELKSIKLFNMFSRTYHCESIAVLERK